VALWAATEIIREAFLDKKESLVLTVEVAVAKTMMQGSQLLN